MPLEQNAKTKLEALERKRWLSLTHITTAIQQQHCKTSQVGLFPVKELSWNLTISAEVSCGRYTLRAGFCSFCWNKSAVSICKPVTWGTGLVGDFSISCYTPTAENQATD